MTRFNKEFLPFLALLLVTAVTSCAPVAQLFEVEARVPAEYKVNLDNKSIAIFTTLRESTPQEGTLLNNDSLSMVYMARGLASGLEKNLDLEDGDVFVFNHKPDSNTVIDADYIRELSFLSNSDIVMVVDTLKMSFPKLLEGLAGGVTAGFRSNYIFALLTSVINVYDGITAQSVAKISQTDTVYWEILSRADANQSAVLSRVRESISKVNQSIGEEISARFFPSWGRQERSLFVYPGAKWSAAFTNAINFKWKEAMDIWLEESKTKDPVKAAAASYNIAVACEMTDRHELALEWLDLSLKSYTLPGVSNYKQYLLNRVEKK